MDSSLLPRGSMSIHEFECALGAALGDAIVDSIRPKLYKAWMYLDATCATGVYIADNLIEPCESFEEAIVRAEALNNLLRTEAS